MILITSFERFGLFRKNISQEVSEMLEKDYEEEFDGEINFITLPVNKEAAESLKAYLKYQKPKIIICLGQAGFKGFRMEVRAYNMEGFKFDSDLAKYISLVSGIKLTDKIGRWYYNDVYYAGLSLNGNVCFLHIGAFADKKEVYNKIIDIIKLAKEVQNV